MAHTNQLQRTLILCQVRGHQTSALEIFVNSPKYICVQISSLALVGAGRLVPAGAGGDADSPYLRGVPPELRFDSGQISDNSL